MEEFALKSPAIYRSPGNTLFRTPSQEYVSAFLRVGNIQTSRHVLDTVFFWLLPKLKTAGAMLTDSWSISSISLNTARLYSRYIKSLGDPSYTEDLHVNFLSNYYNGRKKMSLETRQALSPLRYRNEKKILFLISAVKTQKSLGYLREEIEANSFSEQMDYMSLYSLQNQRKVPTLCHLWKAAFSVRANLKNGFDEVDMPKSFRTAIVVDEKTFMPSNPQVKEMMVRKVLETNSAEFFRKYLGKGVVTAHRNSYFNNNTRERHHGIFIDVGKMLGNVDFTEGLDKKLGLLQKPPSLIIFPPHEQEALFVELVKKKLLEKFQVEVDTVCFSEIEILAPDAKKKALDKITELSNEDIIMVIDDVLTTGGRLTTYQKQLREIPFKGQIRYLVGVSRPVTEEVWKFLKRDLSFRDKWSAGNVMK